MHHRATRGLGRLSGACGIFRSGSGHSIAVRWLACAGLISLGLTVPAPGAPVDSVRSVLAVVNTDTIFSTTIDSQLLQIHSRMTTDQKQRFDYRKLLDKLVNDRLLTQEARRLGMAGEAKLQASLAEMKKQDAIRQYVADHFKPDLTVSEDSIRSYFADNYAKMQIRTISVADRQEAHKLADEVGRGASMDSVAKAVSLDMFRYKGGVHNLKHLADVETTLRQQAQPLALGQISQPFPYREVYAFLRVETRQPADTTELPQWQGKIKGILLQQKKETAWREFLSDLSGKIPVADDSAALSKIMADSAALFTPDFTAGAPTVVFRTDTAQVVTDQQLRNAISHRAMTSGDQDFHRIMSAAVATAKEELILGAAAAGGGYLNHPVVNARYAAGLDSALIEAYLKETVVTGIKFNRAEFEAYYNGHLDDFRLPDQYQFDQIQVKDQAAAQEIARRLAEGADFTFLAKQYDSTGGGGVAGAEWVVLSAFPDQVQPELTRLDVGRVSPPFQTADGWIMLRLAGRRPGQPQPMADVEMKIRQVMFQRKFDQGLDKVLDILKADAVIVYHRAEIDRYFGMEGKEK